MRVTLSTDDGRELVTMTVQDVYLNQMGDRVQVDIKARGDDGMPVALIGQMIDDGELMTSYSFRPRQ